VIISSEEKALLTESATSAKYKLRMTSSSIFASVIHFSGTISLVILSDQQPKLVTYLELLLERFLFLKASDFNLSFFFRTIRGDYSECASLFEKSLIEFSI